MSSSRFLPTAAVIAAAVCLPILPASALLVDFGTGLTSPTSISPTAGWIINNEFADLGLNISVENLDGRVRGDITGRQGRRPSGVIVLDFDFGLTSFGFDLIDIEVAQSSGSFFAAFLSGGTEVGRVYFDDLTDDTSSYFDSTIVFGNDSANTVAPFFASDFGVDSFDEVHIGLGGPGAIDNLVFEPVAGVVPEPATLALLGLGLAGIACRHRESRIKLGVFHRDQNFTGKRK